MMMDLYPFPVFCISKVLSRKRYEVLKSIFVSCHLPCSYEG